MQMNLYPNFKGECEAAFWAARFGMVVDRLGSRGWSWLAGQIESAIGLWAR